VQAVRTSGSVDLITVLCVLFGGALALSPFYEWINARAKLSVNDVLSNLKILMTKLSGCYPED